MLRIVELMNGTWGRLARIALGLVLVGYGLAVLGGTPGIALALLGLLPVALGVSGRCLLEPFTGETPA